MRLGDDILNVHNSKKAYYLNLKRSQMAVSEFASSVWSNHNHGDCLILKWDLGLDIEVVFEEFFDSNNSEPMDSPNYHEYLASLWKVIKINNRANVGIENISEGNLIEIDDKHSPGVVEDLKGNVLWRL